MLDNLGLFEDRLKIKIVSSKSGIVVTKLYIL